MPTYSIDFNNETYKFDSPNENLSEAEAIDIVKQNLTATPITTPPTVNGLPTGGDWLSATQRRVWEAMGAGKELITGESPWKALKSLVPGQPEEILPSFGRVLQGGASLYSTLLAPLEAVGEATASSLGASKGYAKLSGDITGMVGTLGLGLMAKAGVLGPYMLQLAKVLGVGRSGQTIQEAMKHDPQLRFVVSRELEKSRAIQESAGILKPAAEAGPEAAQVIATSPKTIPKALEELARGESTIEELALAAKSPELAGEMLKRKQLAVQQFDEAARSGGLVGEPPPEARFEAVKGVEFQHPTSTSFLPDWMRLDFVRRAIADQLPEGVIAELIRPRPLGSLPDFGGLGTLGTPGTVAAKLSAEGAGAAYEMSLAQMKINQGIEARALRATKAITGVSDQDVRAAVLAKAAEIPSDTVAQSKSFGDAAKGVFKWITDKYEIDRQIIIPRLKEDTRNRLMKQIEKELKVSSKAWGEEVDQTLLKTRVAEKLDSLGMDKWGIKEYLTRIWPGNVRILDDKNVLHGSADYRLAAQMTIRDIVQENPELAGKLHTSTTGYFDADLLRTFRGRVSRQYENITKGMELSPEEIAAAEKGDYGLVGKTKFNPFLLERQGKASGYSKDFLTIMNTYDRVTERWMNLTDLSNKVAPVIKEIGVKQPNLAWMLQSTLKQAWGFKAPLSGLFDSSMAKVPILRDILPPGFLDRAEGLMKAGIVNAYLRFSPRFQGVNATQLLATGWPVAGGGDIVAGLRMAASKEGQALLKQHGITGAAGKVEDFVKGLGPTERLNQEGIFATFYLKARQWGLSDQPAADYAKLRGNIYSQFLGLTTDQPLAFQKARFLAPFDMFTMFQRFPIKQFEMLVDLMKDRNFPGAAKWLGVNLALGGFKAATFGNAGWLTYRLYKDIEKEYGKTVADVFHLGLPSLAGVDVSGSAQLFNLPFGSGVLERLGRFLGGIVGSTTISVVGNMMSNQGPEASALKRGVNSLIERVPLFKQLKDLSRLFTEDYNFKDPSGRLRFEGEAKDVIKGFLGFRQAGGEMGVTTGRSQMRPAELDTFVSSLREVTERRNDVLNYAASRYGQAMLSGVDLGESMQKAVEKEVNQWNSLWPQFPISGSDIMERAQRRQQSALQTLGERILQSSPKAIRQSGEFYEEPPEISSGGG